MGDQEQDSVLSRYDRVMEENRLLLEDVRRRPKLYDDGPTSGEELPGDANEGPSHLHRLLYGTAFPRIAGDDSSDFEFQSPTCRRTNLMESRDHVGSLSSSSSDERRAKKRAPRTATSASAPSSSRDRTPLERPVASKAVHRAGDDLDMSTSGMFHKFEDKIEAMQHDMATRIGRLSAEIQTLGPSPSRGRSQGSMEDGPEEDGRCTLGNGMRKGSESFEAVPPSPVRVPYGDLPDAGANIPALGVLHEKPGMSAVLAGVSSTQQVTNPEQTLAGTGFGDWNRDDGFHKPMRLEAELDLLRERRHHEESRLRREVDQIHDELARKQHELLSRPSHQHVAELKSRVNQLEDERDFERRDAWRKMDTRVLMRRDKRRGESKLRRNRIRSAISEAPREDLEQFAANICGTLGISDLTEAEKATEKLAVTVERHMPQIESFISKVFELVEGGDVVKTQVVSKDTERCNAVDVLATLKTWKKDRDSNETFRSRLVQQLRLGLQPRPSDAAVLMRCAQLAEEEAATKGMSSGGQIDARGPKEEQKIVQHFMQLFQVRSMEGCVPAMSSLHSRLQELTTVHQAICAELRIDPASCSSAALLRRLKRRDGAADLN